MKRLLIANRGEIALRINRTAKKLGIETVIPYVPSESGSPFLEEFTSSKLIVGGGFLDPELMISLASENNCDAIHPGYGFLSESADFSKKVSDAGIIFVGPSASSMRLLGDKSQARLLAIELGIPLSQGYDSEKPDGQSEEALISAGKKIGFPLLIKAAAGGGGRGMRKVEKAAELPNAIQAARREAQTGFGSSKLLLEKFFENGRHVEVQVIGDSFGDVRQLGERDCTLQRRYQKLIEEAPAPNLSESIRARLFEYSVKLAKSANLVGVSTVEFLVNSSEVIFLEVNTRLQVEHPVTEEMLGIDLVDLQLKVAQGKRLSDCLPEKFLSNCAIEVRVVSEDSEFVPATGIIKGLSLPTGIRIEHALYQGFKITGEFDSLLAKVIAVGETRKAAIKKLKSKLADIKLEGVPTNLDFLNEVLEEKDFLEGHPSVETVKNVSEKLNKRFDIKDYAEAAIRAIESSGDYEPLRLIGQKSPMPSYLASCEGREILLEGGAHLDAHAKRKFDSKILSSTEVIVNGKLVTLQAVFPKSKISGEVKAEEKLLKASLAGKVVSINCKVGDKVNFGQVLVVIESMKMEHSLKAQTDGVVKSIYATEGQIVQARTALVEIDA